MNKSQKRTKLSIMFAMLEELGGEEMIEAFKRGPLPRLRFASNLNDEIDEQEYQPQLAQMKKELPAFKRFLLTMQSPGL